jgi:uncharacterized coiled-coil DUF342 family protein
MTKALPAQLYEVHIRIFWVQEKMKELNEGFEELDKELKALDQKLDELEEFLRGNNNGGDE